MSKKHNFKVILKKKKKKVEHASDEQQKSFITNKFQIQFQYIRFVNVNTIINLTNLENFIHSVIHRINIKNCYCKITSSKQ